MIVYFFLDFKGFIAEVLDWIDCSKMCFQRSNVVWMFEDVAGARETASPVDEAKWQNFSLLSTKHSVFFYLLYKYMSLFMSLSDNLYIFFLYLFFFFFIYLQSMYKLGSQMNIACTGHRHVSVWVWHTDASTCIHLSKDIVTLLLYGFRERCPNHCIWIQIHSFTKFKLT